MKKKIQLFSRKSLQNFCAARSDPHYTRKLFLDFDEIFDFFSYD